MGHVTLIQGRECMQGAFGLPEEKRLLERLGLRRKDNIKVNVKEKDGLVWTEVLLLRIHTGGGLL